MSIKSEVEMIRGDARKHFAAEPSTLVKIMAALDLVERALTDLNDIANAVRQEERK